jgi:pre-rRNA-processing protein TSR4
MHLIGNTKPCRSKPSRFNPDSGVGCFPSWLSTESLPLISCDRCGNCNMSFLLQIYNPTEDSFAFHRFIYVFICLNNCGSIKAYRSQLPRINEFLPAQAEHSSTSVSPSVSTSSHTFCQKCGFLCNEKSPCNRRVFKHYKLEIFQERTDTSDDGELSAKQLIKELEQLDSLPQLAAEDELNDEDLNFSSRANDPSFDKYQTFMEINDSPAVIFGDEPVYLTESRNFNPTKCENCGKPRKFEFQVTSSIISLLGLDDLVDFGSIYVYTCCCDIGKDSYKEEHVVVANEPDHWWKI